MVAEHVNSLRTLLLRRLWFPLLLVMALGAVSSYALARYYAQEIHDRWLWDSAMSLTQVLPMADETARWSLSPAVLRMFEWDTVDQIFVEVINARGARLFGTATVPAPTDAGGSELTYYDALIDEHPVRVVQITVPHMGGDARYLRVAETREKRKRLERRLLLSTIPLQAALLLITGLLLRFAARSAAHAANQAAHRLSELQTDNLGQSLLPNEAPHELRPAVEAFNALIEKLVQAQSVQQRFVANAAHQLRTPLAVLSVQLENALRESEGMEKQVALSRVGQGLARLGHVTHQILMLNRSEASATDALVMSPQNLAMLSREVLEAHADKAIARGTDLGFEGPDQDVMVRGEPQLLRELLANLVDNALRYGRPGGVVTLVLRDAPIVVWVEDDGPGIPEDERERVMERFYRLAHDSDGCGLGLSIAREIATRHGAAFRLGKSSAGGLQATVSFAAEHSLDGRQTPAGL